MLAREYERKYRMLEGWSSDGFINTAIESGYPVEILQQQDEVYADSLTSVLSPRPGAVVVRIRVEGGRSPSITTKRRRHSNLDRTEVEFGIDDPYAARHMLKMLGLRHLITVKKVRQSVTIGDRVTVNIDTVDDLGLFCEIEWLLTSGDKQDGDALFSELIQREPILMGHLGIPGAGQVTRGYDALLLVNAVS